MVPAADWLHGGAPPAAAAAVAGSGRVEVVFVCDDDGHDYIYAAPRKCVYEADGR